MKTDEDMVGTKISYYNGGDVTVVGYCKDFPDDCLHKLIRTHKIYTYIKSPFKPIENVSDGLVILPVYKRQLKGLTVTGSLNRMMTDSSILACRFNGFNLDAFRENVKNLEVYEIDYLLNDFKKLLSIYEKESSCVKLSDDIRVYDFKNDNDPIFAKYVNPELRIGKSALTIEETKIPLNKSLEVLKINIVSPGENKMILKDYNMYYVSTAPFKFFDRLGRELFIFSEDNIGEHVLMNTDIRKRLYYK